MLLFSPNLARLLFAALSVSLSAEFAVAQSRQNQSLFGGNGPTSRSSLGGIRTSSGSGYGNTAPGFGTTQGFGTSGLGLGQMGGMGTTAPTAGQAAAGTGFVGRNATQGGFVGAQQSTSTQPGGRTAIGRAGTGQFGAGGLTGAGGLLGRSSLSGFGANNFQNQFNQPQSNNNDRSPVRVRPQIAFDVPVPAPQTVTNSMQVRFDRITSRGPQFRNVTFTMDAKGQVTLSGVVPTEHDAKVAAALLRLEPGVRSVKNELTIAPE